jgi:hypothetical protein
VWAIVAVCLVSLLVQGDPIVALRFAPAFLTAAYLCWMLFWYPCVRVDASGVALVNLVRTVRVTWPAVAAIETKYALTVHTADAKYVAWAAPGPSRFASTRAAKAELKNLPESSYGAGGSIGLGDIPNSDSGLAALNIRRYWEQLQRAGHLGGGLEGTGVTTTWHRPQLVVLGVLVVLTVAGFVA